MFKNFFKLSLRSLARNKIHALINVAGLSLGLVGALVIFLIVFGYTFLKEIGVRKVLGATMPDILALFSKEFASLLALAFVIAAPVAYYFMQAWLADFAYRIELGLGIFLLALLAASGIVLLTVGYKSVAAALANPVEALRYE